MLLNCRISVTCDWVKGKKYVWRNINALPAELCAPSLGWERPLFLSFTHAHSTWEKERDFHTCTLYLNAGLNNKDCPMAKSWQNYYCPDLASAASFLSLANLNIQIKKKEKAPKYSELSSLSLTDKCPSWRVSYSQLCVKWKETEEKENACVTLSVYWICGALCLKVTSAYYSCCL